MEIIFVHVPKTGGTSVRKALYGREGYGHIRARDIKVTGYETISVVRNPFDRAVSIYGHLQNRGKVYKEGFIEFILSNNIGNQPLAGNHVTIASPCVDYICCDHGGILVDHILRFENLVDDFYQLTGKPLGWHNASNRERDYRQYYNREAWDKVAEIYRQDLLTFDYSVDYD